MQIKRIFLLLYALAVISVCAVVFMLIFGVIPYADFINPLTIVIFGEDNSRFVSPQVYEIAAAPTMQPVSSAVAAKAQTATALLVLPHNVKAPEYSIGLISAPKEVVQGEIAVFSWTVGGKEQFIYSSTVYIGKTSTAGALDSSIFPSSTSYTDYLPEFIKGEYKVPMVFTANKAFAVAGVYYGRPYAQTDGSNLWGDEFVINIRPVPTHDIIIIDKPQSAKAGQSITFTWEVTGPPAATGFTVIVGGKTSYPDPLDHSVALTLTPYQIMVNDFTAGNIQLPLRFIGNTKAGDSGTYYFRALVFINGKNIWSPEYSFTVE